MPEKEPSQLDLPFTSWICRGDIFGAEQILYQVTSVRTRHALSTYNSLVNCILLFSLLRAQRSEELKELILCMLDKNPETRITVPEIKVNWTLILSSSVSADFVVPLVSSNETELFLLFVLGAFSGMPPREGIVLILQ